MKVIIRLLIDDEYIPAITEVANRKSLDLWDSGEDDSMLWEYVCHADLLTIENIPTELPR